MSTRAFRRLSRAERRGFINTIEDPLTRRAFEIVFLGPGKVSWRKAALLYGGGISPRPCGSGCGRSCNAHEPQNAAVSAAAAQAVKFPPDSQKPATETRSGGCAQVITFSLRNPCYALLDNTQEGGAWVFLTSG